MRGSRGMVLGRALYKRQGPPIGLYRQSRFVLLIDGASRPLCDIQRLQFEVRKLPPGVTNSVSTECQRPCTTEGAISESKDKGRACTRAHVMPYSSFEVAADRSCPCRSWAVLQGIRLCADT